MHKKIVYTFILWLILIKPCLLLGEPDKIILRDGTKIEGKITEITPEGMVYLQQGPAIIGLDKGRYIRAELGEPPDIYKEACAYLKQGGDTDRTVELFNKVYKEYGQLGWGDNALYKIALIYKDKGDFYQAIKSLDNALAEFPYSEETDEIKTERDKCYYAIGNQYYKEERYEEAVKYFKEIYTKVSDEQAAQIQCMIGDCYTRQKDYEEALLSYLQAVLIHSKITKLQPEALYKAGLSFEQLNDKRAKEYYKELIKKFPDSSYTKKALGKISKN